METVLEQLMPAVSLKGEGRVSSVVKVGDTSTREIQEGAEPRKRHLCRERQAGWCEQGVGQHAFSVKGQIVHISGFVP